MYNYMYLLILDIQVELKGGTVPTEGRVQVTGWKNGSICDRNWDDNDAQVVCRMLGLS